MGSAAHEPFIVLFEQQRRGVAAAGVASAAAAVIAAVRGPERRQTMRAEHAWAYVGATTGLAPLAHRLRQRSGSSG